jgi:hypothetical protein
LLKEIKKIPSHPYAYRKSIYFDEHCVRDLIYRGYIVVFHINEKDDAIDVFGFVKHQQKPTD